MGRPREHNDETREHLLRVATEIIRRGGTEALTVRGLAAEAGVTTRAIYSLFSGLPEVVAELCKRSSAAMLRHHEAVPVTDNPISELLPLALAFRAGAREQADSTRSCTHRLPLLVQQRPGSTRQKSNARSLACRTPYGAQSLPASCAAL
jgi:AcrR family transcriptional regulator